jgi:hypothetical protein
MDVGWLLQSRQKLELTRHRRSDVSRSRKKLGGAPALLGLHPGEKFGHRTTWKTIVPGNFYDAGAGRREFWTRYDGTMQLMAGSWRTDWDMIIPGHFSDNPDTDLLFYGRASGTGEFYGTNGSFSLIGSNPDWRQDWTIIIPGHFSDSPYTDPLFYDASTGTGDFWRTGGHGNVSQIGVSNTNWNRDWTMIIPGRFSDGPYTDLLRHGRVLANRWGRQRLADHQLHGLEAELEHHHCAGAR